MSVSCLTSRQYTIPRQAVSRIRLESLERRDLLSAAAALNLDIGPHEPVAALFEASGDNFAASPAAIQSNYALPSVPDVTAFAQSLAASGTIFYGAWWCPHCAEQKEMFGDAAQFLPYVEVSNPDGTQNEVGRANNIQSYPTWDFPDGTRVTGVKSFEQLSSLSGVAIPHLTDTEVFSLVFEVFHDQFGQQSEGLYADFTVDGRVDLRDFVVLKSVRPAGWQSAAAMAKAIGDVQPASETLAMPDEELQASAQATQLSASATIIDPGSTSLSQDEGTILHQYVAASVVFGEIGDSDDSLLELLV